MLLCVCVCVLAWTCLCICATAASELLVTGSESSSCDVFFTCFSLFLSRPRCVTFNDAQGRLFAVELLWLNFLILLHFGRLYSGFIRGNITIPKHIFLWVLAMLIKKYQLCLITNRKSKSRSWRADSVNLSGSVRRIYLQGPNQDREKLFFTWHKPSKLTEWCSSLTVKIQQ